MTEPSHTVRLLERWYSGDQSALHVLLEEELPWIRERVGQRLGRLLDRLGDAEDYVQDAMVRVLNYGPPFRISDRTHFRGLLSVLIENTLRDEHKYHLRHRRDPNRACALPRDSVLDLDPPRRGITRPSAIAQRAEEQAFMDLAVELLPEPDGLIVRLRTWEELPFGEIGVRVGIQENTARMRFQRALAKVARNFVHLRSGRVGTVLAERDGDA